MKPDRYQIGYLAVAERWMVSWGYGAFIDDDQVSYVRSVPTEVDAHSLLRSILHDDGVRGRMEAQAIDEPFGRFPSKPRGSRTR